MKFKLKEKSEFKIGAISDSRFKIRIYDNDVICINPAGVSVSVNAIWNSSAYSKFYRSGEYGFKDLLLSKYYKDGEILDVLNTYAFGKWKLMQYEF